MKLLKNMLLYLIAAGMLLLCAACGNGADVTGRYVCTDSPAIFNGVNLDEEWLSLNYGGKGTLHLMGKDYAVGWTLEGEELTITQNETRYSALLVDGVISVSFNDLIYTYVKEGLTPPTLTDTDATRTKLNALQEWWNGDWYGYWYISDATELWSELNGSYYDCYATVDLNATGSGSISLWDAGGSLCTAQLKLSMDETESRIGAVHSVEGYFWGWKIGEDDWIVDPALSQYDNMLFVQGGYFEDENGSFRYNILLRPWGQLWDDVAQTDPYSLPAGYNEWYLPLIDGGSEMPRLSDTLG